MVGSSSCGSWSPPHHIDDPSRGDHLYPPPYDTFQATRCSQSPNNLYQQTIREGPGGGLHVQLVPAPLQGAGVPGAQHHPLCHHVHLPSSLGGNALQRALGAELQLAGVQRANNHCQGGLVPLLHPLQPVHSADRHLLPRRKRR